MSDINQRIDELIKLLNLSPNAFAKSINSTSATIYNILKGKNKPGYDLMLTIVFKHEVNWLWLMEGKGKPFLKDELPKDEVDDYYPKNRLGLFRKKNPSKSKVFDLIISSDPKYLQAVTELNFLSESIRHLSGQYEDLYIDPTIGIIDSIEPKTKLDRKKFITENKKYFDRLEKAQKELQYAIDSLGESLVKMELKRIEKKT